MQCYTLRVLQPDTLLACTAQRNTGLCGEVDARKVCHVVQVIDVTHQVYLVNTLTADLQAAGLEAVGIITEQQGAATQVAAEICIGGVRKQDQCKGQHGKRAQALLIHIHAQDSQTQWAECQAEGGEHECPVDGRALEPSA